MKKLLIGITCFLLVVNVYSYTVNLSSTAETGLKYTDFTQIKDMLNGYSSTILDLVGSSYGEVGISGTPSLNQAALWASASDIKGVNEATFKSLFNLEAGTDYYSKSAADAQFEPAVTEGTLTNDVIIEPDLKVSNSPTDNYILSYNAATTGFTWVAQGTGFSTSSEFADLVSDETGSGGIVLAISPTISLPYIDSIIFEDDDLSCGVTGCLSYDNDSNNLLNGELLWYDGSNYRRILDITSGIYTSGSDLYVATYHYNGGNGYFDLQPTTNISGTPTLNQVALWVDADTLKSVDEPTFKSLLNLEAGSDYPSLNSPEFITQISTPKVIFDGTTVDPAITGELAWDTNDLSTANGVLKMNFGGTAKTLLHYDHGLATSSAYDNNILQYICPGPAGTGYWTVKPLYVTTSSVYSGTTYLNETTDSTDSGACLVGVFDEFDNSNGTNVQEVLKDFDGSLGGAANWNNITAPTEVSEIDFGSYTTELNVEDLRIGDGGSNYVQFTGSEIVFAGNYSMSFDFSTITLPSDSDPDVTSIGQLSYDNNASGLVTGDSAIRVSDGTDQWLVAQKIECMHAVIVKPQDLDNSTRDLFPLFSNNSGYTFVIKSINCASDSDDTTLNINYVSGIDWSSPALIDAIEIADDGTNMYYVTETTITDSTLAFGDTVVIDFDNTDDPGWVKISICGYYDANVD